MVGETTNGGEMPDRYEGSGKTFQEAAEKASEKAKVHGKGWYRVTEIQVNVGDSVHDYKVFLGTTD